MIRVLFFVLLLFALALGFAWLAERPGDLTILWQGYQIRTSLIIATAALVLGAAVLFVIGALVRAVIRTPRSVGEFFGGRRRDRGYRPLTPGMIAVGPGDPPAAPRASGETRAPPRGQPLGVLLPPPPGAYRGGR